MSMTIAEKILARASGKEEVTPGEFITAKIDLAMTHIATAAVAAAYMGFPKRFKKVWDPEKIVMLEDHYVPAPNVQWATIHTMIRKFAKDYGIKYFYDVKAGICHQVLPERGHVRPGMLIVGTDSHTTTYGAFNAASAGIGNTDMTVVFSKGELWFQVPQSIGFNIEGKLEDRLMSKDIILYIAGKYGADVATYKSIEYTGKVMDDMTMASRMTMSNMGLEIGGKFAFGPPDNKITDFLKGRTNEPLNLVFPDEDAKYETVYDIDVTDMEPQVACPHTVDNVKPISEIEGTKVDQAFIGSCTNGRLEDLRIAAEILDGKKIHKDCRMIVIPASWEVYKDAMKEGILEKLIDAEAMICNCSCGPCFGAHMGLLAPKENCISSSNRNFRGRMGSDASGIYLASPATVAASAINGVITDPRKVE